MKKGFGSTSYRQYDSYRHGTFIAEINLDAIAEKLNASVDEVTESFSTLDAYKIVSWAVGKNLTKIRKKREQEAEKENVLTSGS